MPHRRESLIAWAVLALAVTAGAAEAAEGDWKAEARALRKQLRHEVLLAREDLQAAGPPPARGRGTELLDGSYYQHEDASVVFEKLGPVMVSRLRLKGASRLQLVLSPPSNLRPSPYSFTLEGPTDINPWDRLRQTGLEIGGELSVVLDLEEFGSVREALASLVFLPGESPSEADRAACLERYPEQAEKVADMRCDPIAKDDGKR